VAPTGNGGGAKDGGLDTSSWFESHLPRAADQPEAKIELSSIADAAPPSPTMPATPSLAQAKDEVREIGNAELPPE
jgi:hypothetical protein